MSKFVLWGHSLDDYREMFDLSESDLNGRLLEVGGGPTTFNADMQARGANVISCDDMFAYPIEKMKAVSRAVFDDTLSHAEADPSSYNWQRFGSLEELAKAREQGLTRFFEDFEPGTLAGRYVTAEFPSLPFKDFQFDLALCAHHLFVSGEKHETDFHVNSILEMARVAHEVRIFPLSDRLGRVSDRLGPVMLALQQNNLGVEVRQVDYSLQVNGNAMLRVWAHECVVD